ncbi:MAG: efflux RND transporter periplasmic adaptor subunit [Rhabdochlamydiaceae bacterium]
MKKWMVFVCLIGCSKVEPPKVEPPYVKVAKPIVCDAPLYFEYIGHVEPNQTVDIKAQVQGVLTGQYFVEGQEVCENSLLMTIDPRPFQVELERAIGELAQNRATLQQARDSAQRYKNLALLSYISQLDYDQLMTNTLTAEAAVQQSQANVDQAKIDLEYCTIMAPFRGVASKLQVDVGNYVPVGGDTPLLTINQISPIRVSFFVPEKDLSKIAPLQMKEPLVIEVVRGDERVQGKLFLINNKVDEATGMILLQALYDNKDCGLWPGEYVDVRLILKIQNNAILVPTQTVQIGQEGTYLYVLKPDQTVELRKVKVGQKEEKNSLIESGLSPDEVVVTEGQLNLSPGIKVLIKP